MKELVVVFSMMVGMSVWSNGERYVEELEKKRGGLGSVSVRERKGIEELMNGKKIGEEEKSMGSRRGRKENSGEKEKKSCENEKKRVGECVKKGEEEEGGKEKRV